MLAFQYIDSQKSLQDCCHTLQQSRLLSVDTEFVRERTFYPQPGLIQVSDGINISLIDPNACENLQIFFDLLQSPEIQIVMHSASEDVELFYSMGCDTIQNLFDTQIAASWLGKGQSLSLQKLVEEHEQIEIEKQLTRTNWLKRPLSEAQLEYAAIDVLYLNSICIKQKATLDELGFLTFMEEDCDLRCEKKSIEKNDVTAYLKVKRAITATEGALARLQKIASWREQQARRDDKPRQHVLNDQQLLAICIENPETVDELSNKCDLPAFVIKRYGAAVLKLINNRHDVSVSVKNNPVLSLRSLPLGGKTLNDCRDLMLEIQQQQQIPREVLPSKRWIEQFLLHSAADWYPMPDGWKGWRRNLLEKPLLEILRSNGFNQQL